MEDITIPSAAPLKNACGDAAAKESHSCHTPFNYQLCCFFDTREIEGKIEGGSTDNQPTT